MNDPNAKYGITKPDELFFFNYHEFLAKTDGSDDLPALVINHFPNSFVSKYSQEYTQTRIVRIPRIYDTVSFSYLVPQFSSYTPGNEPAAITGSLETGEYDGFTFATTSATPLVPQWLNPDELAEIVNCINTFCHDAFSPFSPWTCLDNLAELLTGTLYSRVFNSLLMDTFVKRKLADLDRYVDSVNDTILRHKHPQLRIISPRMSGFLSLDIQIPLPSDSMANSVYKSAVSCLASSAAVT